MSLSRATSRRRSAEDQLDAVFHALCDQTRRALLARLAVAPANITELAEPFAMSLPAVSRHVRVLEGAGLVKRRVDGRVHQCSLNGEPLRSVDDWLCYYRQFWQANLDSLAHYLEAGS